MRPLSGWNNRFDSIVHHHEVVLQGAHVNNKFWHRGTTQCWNNGFWLDLPSHLTICNQTQYIILEYNSYPKVCWWQWLKVGVGWIAKQPRRLLQRDSSMKVTLLRIPVTSKAFLLKERDQAASKIELQNGIKVWKSLAVEGKDLSSHDLCYNCFGH